MVEEEKINSLEQMAKYWQEDPSSCPATLHLLRHLVSVAEKEDKNTLSREAQSLGEIQLREDAREFLAKRIFAFGRKALIPLLQSNLQHFTQECKLDVTALLALLDFAPLPEEICKTLLSSKTTEVIPQTSASLELPEEEIVWDESKLPEEEIVWDESKPPEEIALPQNHPPEEKIALPQNQPAEEEIVFEELPSATAETMAEEEILSDEEASVLFPEEKKESDEEASVLFPEEEKDLFDSSLTLVSMSEEEAVELSRIQKEEELKREYDLLDSITFCPISLCDYEDLILSQLQKLSIPHLARMIQGMMNRYLPSLQEKYPFMKFKENLLKYEKRLTSSMVLLVIINYGDKLRHSLLKKFCQLTDIPQLNEIIQEYLSLSLQKSLEEHSRSFRQALELCQIRPDLQKLLAAYPLYERSLIKKYPFLKIIEQVKKVNEEFEEEAGLEKLLNEHLGSGEANTKRTLQKILVKNQSLFSIQDGIGSIRDINTLFKYIQELRKNPETQKNAQTLFQMIGTLLRGKQRVSLQVFKTGINFLSPALQQRVLFVVKGKLKKDLHAAMDRLLASTEPTAQRWKKLLQILQNPQFTESDFTLFGYPLPLLYQKLQHLMREDNIEKAMKQILSSPEIPDSLKNLVYEQHATLR